MHKNPYWLAFLCAIFALTAIFTAKALYSAYIYYALERETPVLSLHWSLEKQAEEAYFLRARYTFTFKGRPVSGTDVLADGFRNEWAARQALKQEQMRTRTIWHNKSKPENSALQKKFPLKEWISTAVLWGLFFYFLWLGYYVKRIQP